MPGIEYTNSTVDAIYHAEGRAVKDGSTWDHEYVITDHLGNTRVRFHDDNGNGTISSGELLSTHDYYPFGMEWNAGSYQYTYNGKEKNTELGLDWLDYGARWYDPVIGRWSAVDPMANKYASWSTYNYVLNNPIRLVDPNGMEPCPPGTPCDNPLPNMRVRQNRASNLGPGNVRSYGKQFHSGHDLYAPTGTRVNSVMAGKVIASGFSSSYGNYITVQHSVVTEEEVVRSEIFETEPQGDTYYSFYSHLSQMDVAEGDEVGVGDQIGLSGTTGNAGTTNPDEEHLHFEVGTSLRNNGRFLNKRDLVDPNIAYNGVSFFTADPNANQTFTGVIKFSGNGVTYQPVGNTSGDQRVSGRELLNIILSMINTQ